MAGNERINQQDIAKSLGITQAAVSRALKNDPRLSEDVVRKVHAAAGELGYRKNLLAQSLIRGHSQLIGFYPPTMASGYYHAMFRGIQSTLRAEHYHLLMNMWSDDNLTADDDENIRILRDYGTDGLIIVAKTLLSWEKTVHQRMVTEKYPVIFVNTLVDIPGAHCVATDDVAGGCLLMEHLFELGHRQIAMAGQQILHDPFVRRFEAYQIEMKQKCLRPFPVLETTTDVKTISEFLRQFPNVTAFLAIHDSAALELLIALESLGYRVPQDISICGFGNDFMHADQFRIPLTTIEQHGEMVGLTAATNLMMLLSRKLVPAKQLLPVTIVTRLSTTHARNKSRL